MTTRTHTIAVGSATTGSNVVIFTSPVAQITLVKSITASRAAGASGDFQIQANRPGSSVVVIFDQPQLQALAVASSSVWTVLEPGDQLLYSCADGTVFFWISGAKLPMP